MKEPNAFFDIESNAAVGIFSGFMTSEQFKFFFEELNTIRIKNESNKLISDNEEMRILTKDVQNWLSEVWFPQARTSGLEYVACVAPRDPLSKINLESTNLKIQDGIEIRCFENQMEAKSWLMTK
jgi:hypothetical protein